MTLDDLYALLSQAFPESVVTLQDLRNDGQHIAIQICSPLFAGKNTLDQHQMVYKALGNHVGTTFHAVTLKTSTP
jgi:stress-induced morphogen